jgi:hypothetical protein
VKEKKNAHVLSRLLNLYKLIKILAISELDKGNLCMALKMLLKDQVFVFVYPEYRWRNRRQPQYRNCHSEQFRSY